MCGHSKKCSAAIVYLLMVLLCSSFFNPATAQEKVAEVTKYTRTGGAVIAARQQQAA